MLVEAVCASLTGSVGSTQGDDNNEEGVSGTACSAAWLAAKAGVGIKSMAGSTSAAPELGASVL